MNCLNKNTCEVKNPDGTCGASIKGYCDYQEKPIDPIKIKAEDVKQMPVPNNNFFDKE
jgi:hypothetical protein